MNWISVLAGRRFKMVWKRSADVPFPKVWHRFQAKAPDSDLLVWYSVQDLPVERFQDAVQHMKRHFARDEQLNKAKGLENDSVGMEEVVQLWKVMLPERLSLVCFREGSDEIVGVNVLAVATKSDKGALKFTSATFQTIFDTIGYVSQQANVYERYRVDCYLNAMGLSVDPSYRGRGIATELLKARVPLCKGVGLELTSTCFTGPGSQAAAKKAGFREDLAITYAELAQVDRRFVFPGIEDSLCKYMSLKIE
ncbi:uncharacterized protein LOC135702089 [Ochlerotatus camptorhynchus]|uniref:uncharacterized protein LOC135702089 n=1 Tax=Ochlerotatus camptorhynchus TaxID=644619 RepID=UPI0031D311DB